MIYCVIPRELADELYDKMVDYYRDNPNVTVIVDRREGPDRRAGQPVAEFKEKRTIRDRRRSRIPDFFNHGSQNFGQLFNLRFTRAQPYAKARIQRFTWFQVQTFFR